MLTSSARVEMGRKPASTATATPVPMVIRYGVPQRGCTTPIAGGRRWSRLIANSTRDWPSMRISTTEVRPASAPSEMMPEKTGNPTLRNASASGAVTDSWV
jgi:hypothetical protein